MSTFYAVFRDPGKGRLALRRLIEQGVPTDDLSLVAGSNGRHLMNDLETAARAPGEDASAFVGRADDPIVDRPFPSEPNPEDAYAIAEAPYGGGIDTSSLDDTAETIDQTTDPSSMAEDAIERPEGMTEAKRELHDLDLAVTTGFPTGPPEIDDFAANSSPPIDDVERSLEVISVERLGVVVGSGAFATAALDYADENADDDEDAMMRHFREEGVPDDVAREYLDAIHSGAAVLAVGLIPGEVEPPLIEALADQLGAEAARTFDAPRF